MANYELNYTGKEVDALLEKIDTAFGETTVMSDTLTWDGDMTGKEYIEMPTENGTIYVVHVSDAIPTLADISNGGSVILHSIEGEQLVNFTSEEANQLVQDMGTTLVGNDGLFFIVKEDNTDLDGLVFPKKGFYIIYVDSIYMSSLTINNYTGFETTGVKTIDPKYLPSSSAEIIFTLEGFDFHNSISPTSISCNKSFSELLAFPEEKCLNAVAVSTRDNSGDTVTVVRTPTTVEKSASAIAYTFVALKVGSGVKCFQILALSDGTFGYQAIG